MNAYRDQIEELSRFHETVDQAEGHAETARTVCCFHPLVLWGLLSTCEALSPICGTLFRFVGLF